MKEVLLVVLGFLLAHVPRWFDRKRALKTHWCAIRAEMGACRETADLMLKDPRQTPLYRLPVAAFDTSFPVLLGEGSVTEGEVSILSRFSARVHEINRGLDNASEMYHAGRDQKLLEEFSRNSLKAEALITAKEGEKSLYELTREIVDAKSKQKWWVY